MPCDTFLRPTFRTRRQDGAGQARDDRPTQASRAENSEWASMRGTLAMHTTPTRGIFTTSIGASLRRDTSFPDRPLVPPHPPCPLSEKRTEISRHITTESAAFCEEKNRRLFFYLRKETGGIKCCGTSTATRGGSRVMAGRLCRLGTAPLVLLHLCRFESWVDAMEITAGRSAEEPHEGFKRWIRKGK